MLKSKFKFAYIPASTLPSYFIQVIIGKYFKICYLLPNCNWTIHSILLSISTEILVLREGMINMTHGPHTHPPPMIKANIADQS